MDELPRFLGPVFEQASRDWLWQQDDFPFYPKKISSWWSNNPIKHRQEEIDVIASNHDDSEAIVGECKWRNADKLNHEMIDTLIIRAALLPKVRKTYLYFFVKEPTDNFKKYAKEHNVRVVEYQKFFGWIKKKRAVTKNLEPSYFSLISVSVTLKVTKEN